MKIISIAQQNKIIKTRNIISIGDIVIAIVLSILVCSVVVSSWSIWIDEGTTASIASQPSLGESFSYVLQNRGSEAQMPGYVAYVWLWEKLFGHTEIALRLAVAPFLFWSILLILLMQRSVQTKIVLLLLVMLHPFVWYNLNEARSTMFMFFLALISLVHLANMMESNGQIKRKDVWALVTACWLGIMINMLFVFFCAVLTFMISRTVTLRRFLKEQQYAIYVFAVLGMLMGTYYSWTLLTGSGGMKEHIGFKNILGIPYEFLGFLGLGPSRNMLRANGASLSTFIEYPGVAILTIAVCIFIVLLIASKYNKPAPPNPRIPFWSAFFLGIVLFVLVSAFIHFRFWARHISFLLPLVIFGTAEMMDQAFTTWKKSIPLLGAFAAILILWIVSDINVRWNVEYQKENYRAAVASFLAESPYTQADWWAGGSVPAEYYGLQVTEKPSTVFGPYKARATFIGNLKSEEELISYPREKSHKIILFKKYDLFDRYGIIRKFIQNHGYRMIVQENDFEIYRQ